MLNVPSIQMIYGIDGLGEYESNRNKMLEGLVLYISWMLSVDKINGPLDPHLLITFLSLHISFDVNEHHTSVKTANIIF